MGNWEVVRRRNASIKNGRSCPLALIMFLLFEIVTTAMANSDTAAVCAPGSELSLNASLLHYSNITSPNYYQPYPSNADCAWRLDSGGEGRVVAVEVVGMFVDHVSDCTNDSLTFYDQQAGDSDYVEIGRLCRNDFQRPSPAVDRYQSSGRVLVIRFRSGTNSHRLPGFLLRYIAVQLPSEDPTTPSTQTNPSSLTFSLTVAAIGVTAVAIIVVYTSYSRFRRHQRRQQQRRQNQLVQAGGLDNEALEPPPYRGQGDLPPSYSQLSFPNPETPPPPPALACRDTVDEHRIYLDEAADGVLLEVRSVEQAMRRQPRHSQQPPQAEPPSSAPPPSYSQIELLRAAHPGGGGLRSLGPDAGSGPGPSLGGLMARDRTEAGRGDAATVGRTLDLHVHHTIGLPPNCSSLSLVVTASRRRGHGRESVRRSQSMPVIDPGRAARSGIVESE